MSYDLDWHVPDRALLLTLWGSLTVREAEQINEEMLQLLEETTERIILVIDADRLAPSLPFERIRQIFTFMMQPHLRAIFVVAQSKLNRLLLTVIFVMTSANFRLFNSREEALHFVEMQLARNSV